MPVIKVWCLPPGQTEDDLNRLYESIVEATVSISELSLRGGKDITCLFPSDLMQKGLGEEIIIEIRGLFKTADVRQQLAKSVGKSVKGLYPSSRVECFVDTAEPTQGSWTSADEKSESECSVHGSIEHMQSSTGLCPGCGKP